MKYSIADIANMLIDPIAGLSSVEENIRDTWESAIDGKTLLDCLNEVVDNYAQFIESETGWDDKRKLLALKMEIKLRIRPKRAAAS